MKILALTLDQAANQTWDVIVVGTGMGGAAVGYSLAEVGRRILFIEAGTINQKSVAPTGDYAEILYEKSSHRDRSLFFAQAGRVTEPMKDGVFRSKEFVPFLGRGAGGSSALYGMALERFFPEDFATWPFSYSDLKTYYERAEVQFKVKGSIDPYLPTETRALEKPPDLSAPNKEIFLHFKSKGLKPYALPMACDYVKSCLECSGFLCPNNCKNDSSKIYLRPAIEKWGASYLENCAVEKIEADQVKVQGVWVRIGSQAAFVRATIVVLAAGALETPKLLLASSSAQWPEGLSNTSGLVGKYLMRHSIDLYAVKTKSAPNPTDLTKQIALSDLHFVNQKRLGILQSFGKLAPPEVIFEDLLTSLPPILRPLLRLIRPLFLRIIKEIFKGRLILATISEDQAQIQNCVRVTSEGQLQLDYRSHPNDVKKQRVLRSEVSKVLRPYGFRLMKQAQNNKRIAHACGTCRAGLDPKKSVVNSHNQSHDLPNLFIVDASFFATSGTKNPSLTIAANGLRVAEYIIGGKI